MFTCEDSLGALNLYSRQPGSFDAETRGEGLAFAAQAAVALRSAQHEERLRAGMATRNLIGQAQGILMERFKVTPNQAFAILARISQETNSKLPDVARYLVHTRTSLASSECPGNRVTLLGRQGRSGPSAPHRRSVVSRTLTPC